MRGSMHLGKLSKGLQMMANHTHSPNSHIIMAKGGLKKGQFIIGGHGGIGPELHEHLLAEGINSFVSKYFQRLGSAMALNVM